MEQTLEDKITAYVVLRTGMKSDLAQSFVIDSIDLIKGHCGIEEVPPALEVVVRSLAVKMAVRYRTEGLASYSEGGVSWSFDNLLSPEEKTIVNRHKLTVR